MSNTTLGAAVHELINSLLQFHEQKARQISKMDACLEAIEASDVHARSELKEQIASFRSDADKAHHFNEELILSELKKTSAPINSRITDISDDHRAFARIVERLCKKIDDPSVEPPQIVADVEWFLGQYDNHATNEEAILFPLAEQHLSPSAWSRIRTEWDAAE